MSRTLKTYGLALIAVLAMSAVLASSSQAALKFTASSYPALLTGSAIQHKAGEAAPFVHTFTTSGGITIQCKKVTIFIFVTSPPPTIVLVIIIFEECEAKIGASTLPATVTMEDCTYAFHGGNLESGSTTTFEKGEVDLACPAGKTMVVHIYENAAKHTANTATCTLKMAPFTNKGENTFHNVAGSPDDVTATTSVPGISTTREGSILCGAANQTATYTGSTTLRAYEDLGSKMENGTVTEVKEGSQIGLTASE